VRKQMMGYTLPIAEMQMNSAMLRKIAQANMSDTRATGMAATRSDYKVKTLDQLAGSH
jgi:putative hemolysin